VCGGSNCFMEEAKPANFRAPRKGRVGSARSSRKTWNEAYDAVLKNEAAECYSTCESLAGLGCLRLIRHRATSKVLLLSLSLFIFSVRETRGQCAGNVSSPGAAADCADRQTPGERTIVLDPAHSYTLAELIEIAEHHNPSTRTVWERAKQRARELGLAKSAYYPQLEGLAVFGDQRLVNPFPKPLAPRGYIMVEAPFVQPEVTLQYLIFDFGKREATVDSARAEKLAAGADFIQLNQALAFRVASSYYLLVTAQERLQAAQETLRTAQTTQDAAESRLNNGLATLPDVLNARAETSQALFDLQSADGDEKIARVTLTEALGAEPSPNIVIDGQNGAPLPEALTMSIDALIDRAMAGRPDLMAQASRIRAAKDEVRAAKAEYKPKISLSGSVAQTSVWPTADFGQLGPASQPTWSGGLSIQWRIFDGGARKNEVLIAESKQREAEDELTAKHDQATREVWTAYIAFRTALRKHEAAMALLKSANESYSASLDAYKYGVKNLIDVVTAEKQLALARLSGVSARSELFVEAVNLEFATGNLLRNQPPATKLQSQDGNK
jgi:outer membrane protein